MEFEKVLPENNEEAPAEAAPQPESEMRPEFKNAQTPEELYAALDGVGEFAGSDGVPHPAEYWKKRVALAFTAGYFLRDVTKTGGLRNRVAELRESLGSDKKEK